MTTSNDSSLAAYWSPVWMQDTASTNYKADYITRFDYDGNWSGTDNWENLNAFPTPASIYYSVVETTTHYFITYADFHPRDWKEWHDFFDTEHENDMEGVMLVIKKDGSSYGAFQLMITRAHNDLYSYKDFQSILSNTVSNGHEDIDGDVQFYDGHHPYVYVEAKGHGVYGNKRWETSNFPGGDGVVYYYTGGADSPSSGNDRFVGYELRSMNELWERRYDPATFSSDGTFRGDTHGNNAADAPWGWDDHNDGAVYRGDLYMRPAYLVEYYHNGLGSFSQEYIYSSDGRYTGTDIEGGVGNDSLIGGMGDDTIIGNEGNDTLNGGAGNDILDGWTEDDNLYGGSGDDSLLGYLGNDYLYGDEGNDTLNGEDDNDTISGGYGDDTIIGGSGNDILYGSVGSDTFVFYDISEGIDIIKDFQWQEGDKIQISQYGFGATSTSQFSYDSWTGALFFDASSSDLVESAQFATLENKPAGFSTYLDIVLV